MPSEFPSRETQPSIPYSAAWEKVVKDWDIRPRKPGNDHHSYSNGRYDPDPSRTTIQKIWTKVGQRDVRDLRKKEGEVEQLIETAGDAITDPTERLHYAMHVKEYGYITEAEINGCMALQLAAGQKNHEVTAYVATEGVAREVIPVKEALRILNILKNDYPGSAVLIEASANVYMQSARREFADIQKGKFPDLGDGRLKNKVNSACAAVEQCLDFANTALAEYRRAAVSTATTAYRGAARTKEGVSSLGTSLLIKEIELWRLSDAYFNICERRGDALYKFALARKRNWTAPSEAATCLDAAVTDYMVVRAAGKKPESIDKKIMQAKELDMRFQFDPSVLLAMAKREEEKVISEPKDEREEKWNQAQRSLVERLRQKAES